MPPVINAPYPLVIIQFTKNIGKKYFIVGFLYHKQQRKKEKLHKEIVIKLHTIVPK